ncbi:hypothetical protein [Streptomyces dysideae]|uniref:Uncharacterized protein n=1 Tax=Streptomyces dysideae TaxID=909626 RepID=A0A124IDS0_9ACTN|nr:hypothetical protein [Streptomyces dysideae]KUO16010.1 hypothetical protein AQJ91_37910 [Streptomyces dysideae]
MTHEQEQEQDRDRDRLADEPERGPRPYVRLMAAIGAGGLVAATVAVVVSVSTDPVMQLPESVPTLPSDFSTGDLPTSLPSMPELPSDLPTDYTTNLPTAIPTEDLPTALPSDLLPSFPTDFPSLPSLPEMPSLPQAGGAS